MWIVSKNKDLVLNSNRIISFNILRNKIWATYDMGEGCWTIGKYTGERIQEVFERLIDAITHPTDYDDKFEMPDE